MLFHHEAAEQALIEKAEREAAEAEAAAQAEAEIQKKGNMKHTMIFLCKQTSPGEAVFLSGGKLDCSDNCGIDIRLRDKREDLWPEYKTWKIGATKLMDGRNPSQPYEYSVSPKYETAMG